MNDLKLTAFDYTFDRNMLDAWDIIITPFFLVFVYFIAFLYYRKYVTKTTYTQRVFFLGLTLKVIGAIAICFIYSYYYVGGDLNAYFNDGRIIAKIILNDPITGINCLLTPYDKIPYDLSSLLLPLRFANSNSTFLVIKICGVIELFTFQAMLPTALVFALGSFLCLWNLFTYLLKILPITPFQLAFSIFYIPSFFFWGSGILKDTICIALLSILFIRLHEAIAMHKRFWFNIIISGLCMYVILTIKIYILLAFLPSFILYLYLDNLNHIKSKKLRVFLTPFVLIIALASSLALTQLGNIFSSSRMYSIENLMQTSEVTKTYLLYVSDKNEGSGYSLGDFDYTFTGLLSVAPKAINVTLYRPYIWEAGNPVFLLSAIESTMVLLITIYLIFRSGPRAFVKTIVGNNFVIFCVIFCLIFAFFIGISTYNFGSLVRYKIPIIPFYMMALFIIYNTDKKNHLLNRANQS